MRASVTNVSPLPRRLIIMAGLPGCGKSTWAARMFHNHIVSTDVIRASLYDGEYDPTRNSEVFATFHKWIGSVLLVTGLAVADSTALTKLARENLRTIAKACNAETHLVFFTNVHQASVNNRKREPRWIVPEDAMGHMMTHYSDARYDIEDEGYDSITRIEHVQ